MFLLARFVRVPTSKIHTMATTTSGITVVTHNGKMPCDGGLRIAYRTDDGFVVNIGAYVPLEQAVANWRNRRAVEAAATPPKIALSSIHQSMSNFCPECGGWCGRALPKIVETDQGQQTVLTCPYCSSMFRKPEERRRFSLFG